MRLEADATVGERFAILTEDVPLVSGSVLKEGTRVYVDMELLAAGISVAAWGIGIYLIREALR